MRAILAACLLLGAAAFERAPAHADILLGPRGEMTTGLDSRWHPGDDWQKRDPRERDAGREAWLRNGCARDWSGAELCD